MFQCDTIVSVREFVCVCAPVNGSFTPQRYMLAVHNIHMLGTDCKVCVCYKNAVYLTSN